MNDREVNPSDFVITKRVLEVYLGSDEAVTIPYGVTSIGNYAFGNCIFLTSVVIPSGVKSIGDWAFRYCQSLRSVVIPSGVKSIGKNAFCGCSSLTSVVIPSGVENIGDWAFSDCPSLTIYCEEPSIPSGWESDFNCDHRPVVWGYKGD